MKRFIAVLATSLSLVFAIALAQAEGTGSQSSGMMQGESGEQAMSGETQQGMTQDQLAKAEEQLKNASSCTTESGVTINKGEPGFDNCVQAKLDQMKQEQMGGMTQQQPSGSEKSEESMGGESGMDTSQESGQSSGSHSSGSSSY